jgi:hypothetical protein
MTPVAPGLFSTMTDSFQRALRSSPISRAITSGPVAGVKGTTMVIGRLESCCAPAGETTATKAKIARHVDLIVNMRRSSDARSEFVIVTAGRH